MKPFHLQIEPAPDQQQILCTWFGASAIRPEGMLTLPRAPEAEANPWPDTFTIDLSPLLREVVAKMIADAEALAQVDDLLPLRDLVTETAFAELCEELYLFLWRAAQAGLPFALKRSAEGRVWADPHRRLVRVWFATNRRLEHPGDPLNPFNEGLSAETLSYGWCNVFIPQSHQPGRTGSWWRRWIRLEDDSRLELRRTQPLPGKLFWGKLAQRLNQTWKAGERNLFVLVHGFNVSFEEAAIRTAQLGYDLKVPGEMGFFSWPSRGGIKDYPADEATITASVGALAEFLRDLGERSGAERIHLFVHSMGNRGFLAALERLAALHRPALRLGQVFFCAPDEDVRTFADKNRLFAPTCENRTLLVSPDDKAVALSSWLHQHDRVGIVPPILRYPGIETISVSGFGLIDLGHSYFASAEKVIFDLREAIESRRPAAERAIPQPEGDHFRIRI